MLIIECFAFLHHLRIIKKCVSSCLSYKPINYVVCGGYDVITVIK